MLTALEITDEDFVQAGAWADAQLAGKTVDERWDLLREMMQAARQDKQDWDDHAAILWREDRQSKSHADIVREFNEEIRARSVELVRDEMMQCLRREAVRDRVAPHVTRARWSRGLNLRTDLAKWIHTERLRDTAYAGGQP